MRCGFEDYITEIMADIPRGVTLIEVEFCYLSMLYMKNKGNKTHTAKEAGISLTKMQNRVKDMEYFDYHVEPIDYKYVPRRKSKKKG